MPAFTQSDIIAKKLKNNRSMSELQFFARELLDFKKSAARREMLDGERYYSGNQDILGRVRTAIGNDGKLQTVANLPNNKILDNQYAKHLDQKKNYLLGKPISFESENEAYVGAVKKVLGRKFMRELKNVGCEALCGGIAWLYPYYDNTNTLAFRLFPSYEILPFWSDGGHTELDCALRLYELETYVGQEKKTVEKVDVFKVEGVSSYVFENGILKPDPEAVEANYITVVDAKGEELAYNWERVPLIAVKYNAKEIPLIRRVKQLQDAINLLMSDFVNNMQEDVRNTILVLSNHDGTDLGEFRHNLSTFGVVKVRTVDGVGGAVSTLHIEVDADNYKIVLELLKKALIENARSYDGKDDRLSGNPNQMNIQSMYSDIDLDANDMETEMQASFEDILWFVNKHLANTGAGDFEGEDIGVIFNRDMLINETEAIGNCVKSVGIISNETIISQHPWTSDTTAELSRLKAEKAEAEDDPYRGAFEAPLTGGVANEK
ncbi:MAG: phage portal protein [Oscillospiraceae bacterium]